MKNTFLFPVFTLLMVLPSCKNKNTGPAEDAIDELALKRGEIISCGALDKQFGTMEFETSSAENVGCKGHTNSQVA